MTLLSTKISLNTFEHVDTTRTNPQGDKAGFRRPIGDLRNSALELKKNVPADDAATQLAVEFKAKYPTIASQTAALIQYAETEGFVVPKEWIFQDEGYSGANIVRPGLEAIRDLAAEGHIEAVLIHSPDRLSRKYAYQVLHFRQFVRTGRVVAAANSDPWPVGRPAASCLAGQRANAALNKGRRATDLPARNLRSSRYLAARLS
jgi:hypothetical protein